MQAEAECLKKRMTSHPQGKEEKAEGSQINKKLFDTLDMNDASNARGCTAGERQLCMDVAGKRFLHDEKLCWIDTTASQSTTMSWSSHTESTAKTATVASTLQ